MSSIFWKCSELNLYFQNGKRKSGKNFYFWDNCIWRCCYKLSLLRTKCFSLAVNVLTNSSKIFHITKRDFFQLNCLHSDQQIWQRCCRSDFDSVSARLPCYLSNRSLKRDFLDIYLTTFFGVPKFKKISPMTVIFFLKMLKIESKFRKCKKESRKFFFFLR